MPKLNEIVAEFQQQLSTQNTTFLLVYTRENAVSGTMDAQIVANAGQLGIKTVLAGIIRPTSHAVALVAKALEDSARAASGILPKAIDEAADDGAFKRAATTLFEALRPHFTLVGWGKEPSNGVV